MLHGITWTKQKLWSREQFPIGRLSVMKAVAYEQIKKKIIQKKIDKVVGSQSGGAPKKRGCHGVHDSNPPDDLKHKNQTDS